jgi:hypothetical protein
VASADAPVLIAIDGQHGASLGLAGSVHVPLSAMNAFEARSEPQSANL